MLNIIFLGFLMFQLVALFSYLTSKSLDVFLSSTHRFSSRLRVQVFALLGFPILFFSVWLMPRADFFQPPLKIMAAESSREMAGLEKISEQKSTIVLGKFIVKSRELNGLKKTIFVLIVFLIGWQIFQLSSELVRLRKQLQRAFLFKKIGRLEIFISEEIFVPFSVWLPKRFLIVMPEYLLRDPKYYRAAVFHEIQHHRQGDTQLAYLFWLLRIFTLIPGLMKKWETDLSALQEFACDETLLGQSKVEAQVYANCIFTVANKAFEQKVGAGSATAAAYLLGRQLIRRRMEMILCKKQIKTKSTIVLASALMTIGIAGFAYAAKNAIQDRRITTAEARRLAQNAQANSEWPIIVNDAVLVQLNRYAGTPEGRDFMRQSLQNSELYREEILAKLNEMNMPEAFLYLPIVESGYRNLPPKQNPLQPEWNAAGLWQFIESTARHYGLRVDSQRDERMNEAKATDAALRLLQANFLRFRDWQLSTMAYNMGENALQKGIDRVGSRNAWDLIQNGVEGDKNYLAKFMAVVILSKNQQLLND